MNALRCSLRASSSACFWSNVLLGALDERQHVAHAQDAAGQPVGVERLERVGLLAGAQELDRQPGHRADRQRRAAAGVAVDLGQDQAGDRRRLGERLGDGDRLLADHRVDHEQRLGRLTARSARPRISSISGWSMDVRPAVSMITHVARRLCLAAADAAAARCRAPACPCGARWTGMSSCLPERLELVGRGGTVRVGGDEHRPAALLGDVPRELGRGRRLARALEADEHDHDRRRAGQVEGAVAGAEDRGQLLVDDLDDLLAGVEALEHVGADGPLADARHEVLDDLVVDVRLEQGEANLAHGGIDVGLGDAAAAGQLAEDVAQAVGKVVEHGQ